MQNLMINFYLNLLSDNNASDHKSDTDAFSYFHLLILCLRNFQRKHQMAY